MIKINVTKAKLVAHDMRRARRDKELAPLDIKATIPAEAKAAETARQVVRDKYTVMQDAIDKAKTIDQLLGILSAAATI